MSVMFSVVTASTVTAGDPSSHVAPAHQRDVRVSEGTGFFLTSFLRMCCVSAQTRRARGLRAPTQRPLTLEGEGANRAREIESKSPEEKSHAEREGAQETWLPSPLCPFLSCDLGPDTSSVWAPVLVL